MWKSLSEKYFCSTGCPPRRDKHPISRWELAARVNLCLNHIERLLQENVSVLPEDIEKLNSLVQEFAPELKPLGTSLDNWESRLEQLKQSNK